MLLQDEQYIVHWLTQYGPLPQTQIVSLLRHKPPEVAAKIIRGLKRQQMIFDIAGRLFHIRFSHRFQIPIAIRYVCLY